MIHLRYHKPVAPKSDRSVRACEGGAVGVLLYLVLLSLYGSYSTVAPTELSYCRSYGAIILSLTELEYCRSYGAILSLLRSYNTVASRSYPDSCRSYDSYRETGSLLRSYHETRRSRERVILVITIPIAIGTIAVGMPSYHTVAAFAERVNTIAPTELEYVAP
jgi:hypothetical protein